MRSKSLANLAGKHGEVLLECRREIGRFLVSRARRNDDARLDGRYLEVELTESAVMSDPEVSVTILEQLSQMGVQVSVDDFGTGYSSMSYLRRLPVDKLKIDREFSNEIMSRQNDVSIVRAIVSLAHSLRLKVVAEGVETPGQLEILKSMGCDEYQGYLFSPAVPAEQFAAILERPKFEGPFPQSDAKATKVCSDAIPCSSGELSQVLDQSTLPPRSVNA